MLKELSLKDKPVFERFLGLRNYELSVYSFSNIFIWKRLFKIYWKLIDKNLCVFFKDRMGCFMNLAPLGARYAPRLVESCFHIMDRFNQAKSISRIENVEEKDLNFFRQCGYLCQAKYGEYLCKRDDLIKLQGNPFKSKRASINYFLKNYQFEYADFSLKDKNTCLQLYARWASSRSRKFTQDIYQMMLKDSQSCLSVLLNNYTGLDIVGKIIKINKRTKAFTFGYKLNPWTFCILFEICDLSVKGLAQFIFKTFSQGLKDSPYVNIMDDSGLDNLKRVKLSYRPFRIIPSFIVKRNDVN